MSRFARVCLIASVLFGGCQAFDVNVATPEPIQVDVDMDVHVYQHGKPDVKVVEKQADYRATMDRRRDRMAEIQELKNNRLIGENHNGLVEIINRPAGEYGEYVEETVEAENEDRDFLMRYEADEKNVTLDTIQAEQWRHWQRKSFPGEWIEVEDEDEDGTAYEWIQKAAANEDGE